jgi:hypothetical protein
MFVTYRNERVAVAVDPVPLANKSDVVAVAPYAYDDAAP